VAGWTANVAEPYPVGVTVGVARESDPERARVLDLLRKHGWNATSFQVLERGFRYAFDERCDACCAYVETRGAWVVAGAPIAAAEDCAAVAERFAVRARDAGKRACFFAVEDRFVRASSLASIPIGEQPVWDPTLWEDSVRAKRSLREQLRRARAKGVAVRRIDADVMSDPASRERRETEALIRRWLASRGMAPMGFLVDVQPFEHARERRYFAAERGEELVALLVCVPVYARPGGWLLEDLLRDPRAPNGTAELLVDAAMRALAAEGARYATLGLAPLAGEVHGALRAARAWSRALYDFEGVRAFKAKLHPRSWEPIHLAYPPGASATVAVWDALAAFARGSLARFGVETLLHGPAVVVRALAAMLVPWTALLAASPARLFPARWVQGGWIAFDVALAGALFALAARWRAGLARALAAAITVDAIATVAEAAAYNAPRVRGARDVVAIGVACAAPVLASIILWSALRRRA
jgi:phosphatidylglycerol lysyltransferase